MAPERAREWAAVLRTLAHPTRIAILEELARLPSGGSRCVGDIQDLLEVPQPGVSQHLAALRERGLVASSKRGNLRCYRLARPELVRSLLAALGEGDRPGPSSGEGADGAEPLVCMKDDTRLDRSKARCLHPSSRCRFREWCEVRTTARAAGRRRRPDGAAPPGRE